MIREWGSPTLFLTFSCTEYESPGITEFLMKVNDVPPSYNIGKRCSSVQCYHGMSKGILNVLFVPHDS